MAIDKLSEYTLKRNCPVCESTNFMQLGSLKITTLLKSNPGYNKEWFNHHPNLLNASFPFVKCNECYFVYSQYKLSDDLTFDYYNEGVDAVFSEAKIYNGGKRNQLVFFWHKLLDNSKLESPIKVLDYGAGWGDFLAVAKCIGVDVFGLEFDHRKIDFALRNGIQCGDFAFIEKNAPYDIFMCNQVLEHLDKPIDALFKLRSLLKKGAIGYVSVPNFPIDRVNEQIRLIEQGKLPSKDFDPLGHLNYFDVSSFRRVLNDTGFEEIIRPKPKNIRGKLSNLLNTIRGKDIQERPSLYVKAI
ncbi:class I SAM-dependent methyltransferase [Cognataquiflexum rubidum]|uniref:class I SAM-dependent methyltransferase n=1 Tax=Cognataquiflexum rubidum TaxID=2922273 RepID=UPI001F1478E2